MRLGPLAVLGLVLVVSGCDPGASELDEPGSDPEPESVEWQPEAGTLMRYVSSWDWSGAQQAPTGEWVFETDSGVRVGIELGYLSTSTMMLVPCSDFRSHSTISDDSLLTGPWIEAFAEDTGELQYGFATASGERYCSLHWLAATSEELGASIEIHGWFELDGLEGSSERERFSASVPLANGGLRPLYTVALPTSSGATVRLVRRPALALDGVDIEALTPSELAFEFLQGLARSSQVWIED
jgi:hypothetical protein